MAMAAGNIGMMDSAYFIDRNDEILTLLSNSISLELRRLLVWEDWHYEPSRNSGIDGTDLLLKEWEGLWSYQGNQFPHIGIQGEDRVSLLLNKMMINNHVHIVREGIVGRAAFTDAHVWILQQNIIGDQYPSEVLPEVYHQFSAGMQTVAAIPVLPHGVVQLGSTLKANRDVTRMEIFLSLVHLLEQAMKTGASVSQEPDNSNTMVHNSYHPVSIPVTGSHCMDSNMLSFALLQANVQKQKAQAVDAAATRKALEMLKSRPDLVRMFALANKSEAAVGGNLQRGARATDVKKKATTKGVGGTTIAQALPSDEANSGTSQVTQSNGVYEESNVRENVKENGTAVGLPSLPKKQKKPKNT